MRTCINPACARAQLICPNAGNAIFSEQSLKLHIGGNMLLGIENDMLVMM